MHTNKTIHVMHGQPVMSAGLAAILVSPHWTVSLHTCKPEALARADIVVADYDTGLAFAHKNAGEGPQVLIVTHRDREAEIRRALSAGVAGYLRQGVQTTQLHEAVRQILAGAPYLCPQLCEQLLCSAPYEPLTRREGDVLRLMAKGYCDKLIARDLGIGLGTVKCHVRGLICKLRASARTQAVVVAAQRGLVGIDSPN